MANGTGNSQSRARTRRSSALPDFEELFHLLIENVRDYAIFILDPDGYALTWNVGVGRLLGYNEREFLGLHFRTLFRADEQDDAAGEMERAAAAGRSEDERWHVRKDGSQRWISGVLTALRDRDGSLRGFAKIMRDSTAQRAATIEREDLLQRELRARQQAEEASRTKDGFLAMISHELRTPLNAMLGWTRMLASGQLDDTQTHHAIEIVERNAQAQARLVAELLDVSRIATGKLQLHVQPMPLHAVIQSAIESVQHAALAKDVTINATLTQESSTIDGDPDRLHQVMLNLLSNAIKFTPPRGVIDVALASDADVVQVTVRDTGKGIPPDLLPRVFEQFQQGDRGDAPTSGLGLGLSIARHIVELHRGTIDARSDGPGQGATFVVRLPRASRSSIEPVRSTRAENTAAEHRMDLRGRCVLIVEDQQESGSLVAFVLEGCGMRVFTTDRVQAVFTILSSQPVDVLISDVRLSGAQDGLDLMRDLRSQSTPVADVPAIALTDDADVDDRARALAAGYDLDVAKPIDPGQLIEAVMAVLRSRVDRKALRRPPA